MCILCHCKALCHVSQRREGARRGNMALAFKAGASLSLGAFFLLLLDQGGGVLGGVYGSNIGSCLACKSEAV